MCKKIFTSLIFILMISLVIVFNLYGEKKEEVTELTKVKIGITPYGFAMMFPAMHETGIDHEFGIDFEIVDFPSSAGTFQALVRGDLDIVNEDMSIHIAALQNAPEIVTFGTNNLFKGFILIGRKGVDKSYKEVLDELGSPEAAKSRILKNMKGREFVAAPFFAGVISDALQQVGLTLDDVKYIKFADDQKAASAYISGVGDFYLGSLPQEVKMLNMPDQFVNMGGNTEIMGPASLFYGGIQTTRKYYSEKYETLLRVQAAFYRGVRYLRQALETNNKNHIWIQLMREHLNKRTAGTMKDEEMWYNEKNYEEIFSYERAWEVALDPKSDLYWKITGDYQMNVEIGLGHLDGPRDLKKDFILWEKTYADLSKRKDLLDLINKPLTTIQRKSK